MLNGLDALCNLILAGGLKDHADDTLAPHLSALGVLAVLMVGLIDEPEPPGVEHFAREERA